MPTSTQDNGIGTDAISTSTDTLIKEAENMSQQYEQQIKNSQQDEISEEIMQKITTYKIQEWQKPYVENIMLPKFYINCKIDNSVFGPITNRVPVTQEVLLEGFSLSKEDKHIVFNYNTSNIKKIDIDEKDENNIIAFSVKEKDAQALENYYSNISDRRSLITQLSKTIRDNITQDNTISDGDLHTYILGVLEGMEMAELRNLGKNIMDTVQTFKNKIRTLKANYAKLQFESKILAGQITLEQKEPLPSELILTKDKAPALDKKMYQEEEGFNGFERDVIEQVITLDCVRCWHRNQERGKGFCINGFINAYPDFIIVLKNGTTVLLETKGKHLDGSDSQNKVAIGDKWSNLAGSSFFYFMVFEDKPIAGAMSVGKFIECLKQLGSNA